MRLITTASVLLLTLCNACHKQTEAELTLAKPLLSISPSEHTTSHYLLSNVSSLQGSSYVSVYNDQLVLTVSTGELDSSGYYRFPTPADLAETDLKDLPHFASDHRLQLADQELPMWWESDYHPMNGTYIEPSDKNLVHVFQQELYDDFVSSDAGFASLTGDDKRNIIGFASFGKTSTSKAIGKVAGSDRHQGWGEFVEAKPLLLGQLACFVDPVEELLAVSDGRQFSVTSLKPVLEAQGLCIATQLVAADGESIFLGCGPRDQSPDERSQVVFVKFQPQLNGEVNTLVPFSPGGKLEWDIKGWNIGMCYWRGKLVLRSGRWSESSDFLMFIPIDSY
ncbi:MAG: hypothetical protein M3R04_00410 [bacterium]|nr:hypothetical protein [bacterium]